VIAVGTGTATINCTALDGSGVNASCMVTVLSQSEPSVPVTNIILNSSSLALHEGGRFTLEATVLPSNATNKNVEWNTSNRNVATVSNGEVIAVSEGTANITCTALDGSGTRAICSVRVTGNAQNESVLLLPRMVVGRATTIELSNLLPLYYTGSVNWTVGNESIAKVIPSKKGSKLTSTTVGSTTLTAQFADNRQQTINLTVMPRGQAVSKLTAKSSVKLKIGQSVTIKPGVRAVAGVDRTLYWSTSDSGVATVKNGVITAKGVGTCRVLVIAQSGKRRAIKVTVKG
ncbi:MAG: Ig-like domain-containing protein, partial [Clostridia bacterium]|nr:Ig-like domain-containing protein [Clostridia bacterium]